jgi:hypothetical protein
MVRLLVALVMCVAIVGCGGSRLSKSNYDKIKTGMTEAEVDAILGPGDTDTSIDVADASVGGINVPGMSAANKTWKDGERSIHIGFMNGKVQTKMGEGL